MLELKSVAEDWKAWNRMSCTFKKHGVDVVECIEYVKRVSVHVCIISLSYIVLMALMGIKVHIIARIVMSSEVTVKSLITDLHKAKYTMP